MKTRSIIICSWLSVCLLASCKKEYVEIVPVTDIQPIQLPTQGTIKFLDFPTNSIGFAGTGTGGQMYRTLDGGQSWTTIQLPYPNYYKIAFSNADTGTVLMSNGLYRTIDGGENWTATAQAVFVCKLSNDQYVIGTTVDPWTVTLKRSTNHGASFQNVSGMFPWGGKARAFGDKLFLFGPDGRGRMVDPVAGTSSLFGTDPAVYNGTNDLYIEGTCGVMVGNGGDIQTGCVGSYFSDQNPWSRWDIRAVDGKPGSDQVAVGENTIMSNRKIDGESEWNYIFNSQGEGIRGSFHAVKVLEQNKVLIGAANGIIFNCSFQ